MALEKLKDPERAWPGPLPRDQELPERTVPTRTYLIHPLRAYFLGTALFTTIPTGHR